MAQENSGAIKPDLKEEFDTLAATITKDIDAFRLHTAAETLYNYIWTRFADEILEESKKELDYGATLHYILSGSLKLLHPFMPFVTESLWEILGETLGNDTLLMTESWPQ